MRHRNLNKWSPMYSFLLYLFQPYTLAMLLLSLAVLNLWRKRRETRGRLLLLTVPWAALVLLSTPAAGYLAVGSLEWQHPPLAERPADADVIIVLGGGVLVSDEDGERAELDATSVFRCLRAAELYRQGPPCRVLVSGGKPFPDAPGPACADLMAAFLRRQGVRAGDLIVENASRDTAANAAESAQLLARHHLRKPVLVTEAVHLFRAVRCFQKQGVDVVPAGCRYRKGTFRLDLYTFLPSLNGLNDCQEAAHEWLGLAWYWLHGRL
jgi:uncharacterized SAM-binding protein YcdF (DUF218 family)